MKLADFQERLLTRYFFFMGRGRTKDFRNVISDADDNNSVRSLRNAVFFKLVEMRKNFITDVNKGFEDLPLSRTFICADEPANILRNEKIGLKFIQSLGSKLIKQTVFAVQPCTFADEGKIFSGET